MLFIYSLRQRCQNTQPTFQTASIQPGLVASNFTSRSTTLKFSIIMKMSYVFRYIFFKDCKMGAQTTFHAIYEDYSKLKSGAYFDNCAEATRNIIAEDLGNRDRIMKFTKQIIYEYLGVNVPIHVKRYFEEI